MRAIKQIVHFGWEQALSCLFPAVIFASLAITQIIPLPFLPRYDWLLIICVLMQLWMVRSGLETRDELKVITLFHLIGLALELFKVHMGSWSYPEEGYSKIFGVPLYSGFMYASVASYLCQAWRRLNVELVKYCLFCSCSACRSDLFEFFHPPFFYRHSMVAIWACHHCLLANMGYIRGEWSSLPYAARTFFCTHRIFYMDSGKYRYVFWSLEISKPTRYMESCTPWKGKFMALASDC